jgi:hemin uptake protein HemP
MRIVIISSVPDDKSLPDSANGVSPTRRPTPARVRSESLLGPARELIIEHDGREYHLRLTQQGKLILTA